MGVGLGENSPIVLSLGRSNYEAMIQRHGQFIRWRIANKCTCINRDTFQPNIRCKKCGGRGFIYDFQKTAEIVVTVMAADTTGFLQLDSKHEKKELVKVYDFNGRTIPAEKKGCFVIIPHPVKGDYYNIVLRENILKTLETAECTDEGAGYFKIKNLTVRRSGIDGIYYNSPCDILKIGKITDENGSEFEAVEFRQNSFYIKDYADISGPLRLENVEYIEPFVFALLNQEMSKADAESVVEYNGDAICSFPYRYDVAMNDVLTVLSGTYTNKETVNRLNNEFDVISAYFVDEVIYCAGKTREYKQGKDFLLVGTNRIKWIAEDAPEAGEVYSITYKVYPTYMVIKSIPQIRSSEDQRLPKKAVVKFITNYTEMTKINAQ